MKETKREDRRQWPTGVLTAAVVTKDVKRDCLPRAILYTVAAIILGAVTAPVLMASTDMDLRNIALLAGTGILAALALREWLRVNTTVEYRIEQDRIVGKQMQITYEDKDAELTGLATRVPVLELEKHGTYRIEADHIHRDFREYELFHQLEEGEELYLIYSTRTKKLLHIYRCSCWTLPE